MTDEHTQMHENDSLIESFIHRFYGRRAGNRAL